MLTLTYQGCKSYKKLAKKTCTEQLYKLLYTHTV